MNRDNAQRIIAQDRAGKISKIHTLHKKNGGVTMMLSRLRPTVHRLSGIRSSLRSLSSLKESYDNVQVEVKDNVGLIRLHRPKALNALSDALFADLIHAAQSLDENDEIGCMVLTGSSKAFAAGADISEMKDRTFDYTYQKVRFFFDWSWCQYVSTNLTTSISVALSEHVC